MSDALEIAETKVVVRGLLEDGDDQSSLKLILLTRSGNGDLHAIEATYVWRKHLWQMRGGVAYCLSGKIENWYTRGMGKLYRMITEHDGQCYICKNGQSTEQIDPTNPVIMPILCAVHAEAGSLFSQRNRDLLQKRFAGFLGEQMHKIRIREGFSD